MVNKRNQGFLNNIYIFYFFSCVFLFFSLYLLRQNLTLQDKLNKSSRKPFLTSTIIPTKAKIKDTTVNWKLYKNDKFGFTIKYPSSLELYPEDYDIKKAIQEYIYKCESGIINGCGGHRWPDFVIRFYKKSGKIAFDINIHQIPLEEEDLTTYNGRVFRLKDNFTIFADTPNSYYENVILEPLDKETIKLINLSMQFYKSPQKNLTCLWSLEAAPGSDPVKDKDDIEKNKKNLILTEGYYYNWKSNLCESTSFYIWKDYVGKYSPPFKQLTDCVSACKSQN